MKQQSRDLTTGSLPKQIFLFSIPLMLSNVLQILFNMSDIAVVGRFAGSLSLGSVGSTTTLVALYTGFLIGMATGVNVLVARYYGSRNFEALSQTIHTAALLCLFSGIVILLLGLASARWILDLLQTKPELMDGALLYLRIYFLGMPALAIYNFGNAVFSAIGNTKKPLVFLLISGIVNVLLNLFFVIVCRLDVAGVAIASVLSQYISAFMIALSLLRSRDAYGLRLSQLRVAKDKARAVLSIGIPSGLQYAIFQIANLFVQAGVNTFSAVMVSGNAAASNADSLVYDIMAAFYTACSSFIGQNYGARKKDRILKSYLISLAFSFGAGALLGLGFIAVGPAFLSLFTKEAAVVEAGMKRLSIMGLSYGMSAFMDCSSAASRGLGKSVVPTIIVVLGSCVFRVIWVFTVFSWFKTVSSLYLIYIFSWTITSIAEILYFRRCYKQQTAAFSLSRTDPSASRV